MMYHPNTSTDMSMSQSDQSGTDLTYTDEDDEQLQTDMEVASVLCKGIYAE